MLWICNKYLLLHVRCPAICIKIYRWLPSRMVIKCVNIWKKAMFLFMENSDVPLYTMAVFEALLCGGILVTEPTAHDPQHRLSVNTQEMVTCTIKWRRWLVWHLNCTIQMYDNHWYDPPNVCPYAYKSISGLSIVCKTILLCANLGARVLWTLHAADGSVHISGKGHLVKTCLYITGYEPSVHTYKNKYPDYQLYVQIRKK